MTSIAISPATPADAAATLALWQACALTRPWNDAAADFAKALATPTATILLARGVGDNVIASVMVGFDGHRGWVYYLGVHPAQRRSGLGKLMMHSAEDWLRSAGAPAIRLMVRSDNAATVAFYAALGYSEQPVTTLGRRLEQA
jgi:ribosomal protein S18 acetylase RimI-like enzyme